MLIHLHKQATTTPKVRAVIQASREPASVLAERFGTTEQTIYKWRHRDSVLDRSHTAHRLQTTLAPAQEAIAIALRKTLLVSLDDLLAVVREFLNPDVSRSGLDRCLRRHGVGNLRDLKAKDPRPKHSGFKAYEPGYIHIDVKYLPKMADESSRRYLFVAIDRATRWVFVRVYNSKTAANARRFLRDLERACSLRIRTILTPFRDIAAQYPVGQWTTEKSLLTVCLVCVNGREARVRQALTSDRVRKLRRQPYPVWLNDPQGLGQKL
jgi:transposase-like protein